MLTVQWIGVRNAQGFSEGLAWNKKGERRKPFPLLPDLWCLIALRPRPPCRGGLYPKPWASCHHALPAVVGSTPKLWARTNPLSLILIFFRYLITEVRKVANTNVRMRTECQGSAAGEGVQFSRWVGVPCTLIRPRSYGMGSTQESVLKVVLQSQVRPGLHICVSPLTCGKEWKISVPFSFRSRVCEISREL